MIWLFNVNDPGSRLIRWRLKLEEYNYKIIHKAGRANANADALSRNMPRDTSQTKKEKEVLSVTEEARSNESNEESENSIDKTKTYTEEEKRQIMHEYHDAPTGGHQGI